jgi:hypothetical protein
VRETGSAHTYAISPPQPTPFVTPPSPSLAISPNAHTDGHVASKVAGAAEWGSLAVQPFPSSSPDMSNFLCTESGEKGGVAKCPSEGG